MAGRAGGGTAAGSPAPSPASSPESATRPAPDLRAALAAAVAGVGGDERSGQVAMATAVGEAFATGEHLLVQAGTGTGKSLAYLVPAILRAVDTGRPCVVATATIALQRQLVERDLPLVAEALEPLVGRRPTYAILKGRHHYACLHRLNEGMPPDEGEPDALFDPTPRSALGRDVIRLRQWADQTSTGDRDELAPAPLERAWRSVSVTSHECLGAARCGYAQQCYAEVARARAREVDIVVTNHAMLAIDAFAGIPLLPEHDAVVVDEAHELVDRATDAVTDELSQAMVERAARRARRHVEPHLHEDLLTAAGALGEALAEAEAGRIPAPRGALFDALVAVRDLGHAGLSALSGKARGEADAGADAERQQARAALEEVHEIAGRIVAAGEHDVLWVRTSERRPPVLHRAPLSVAGLLRDLLFGDRAAVLTSATLELGGSFDAVARSLGLLGGADPGSAPAWHGLDVGSPFDYPRQGILYVARRLPPPGRGGPSPELLDELAGLIEAAGGRTLGLFSSQRAAVAAAEALRERLEAPILCQGDDATAELVRQFAADPPTCLFGTLSLWQGVDVPGESCALVAIDRIPFAPPDDPLHKARVEAAGPAGFMAVSVADAALMLAQGAGRLIRSQQDRGVVALLDSRAATARYGSFLLASLPPFWRTDDGQVARAALARLAGGGGG
jgi:ATP-dependent DNA helicase DinG